MHERRAWRPAAHESPGPLNAGLTGTGLVADDLWLLGHDDRSGRRQLQPRALGIGLAGGLLAELMLGASVGMRPDGALVAHRTWPADPLGRQVRDQVAAEPEPHIVREWLLFLARSAADEVAGRLGRAGYLTRAGRRVPWRPGRWVPVDPDWAFAPVLRVRSALDPARPATPYAATLAGLAVACGLSFRLDQYQAQAGRSAQDVVAALGSGLRELISQTRTAVDSTVLSHRM